MIILCVRCLLPYEVMCKLLTATQNCLIHTHLYTQYNMFSPPQEVMCKLLGATQNCCVFFSSFSILLIAVDRYIFIVHPTTGQISTRMVSMYTSRDGLIFLVHVLGQNGENGKNVGHPIVEDDIIGDAEKIQLKNMRASGAPSRRQGAPLACIFVCWICKELPIIGICSMKLEATIINKDYETIGNFQMFYLRFTVSYSPAIYYSIENRI